MNRTITTLATVAAIAFGGAAVAQDRTVVGAGFSMLQTALVSDFERMGIPTDTLNNLTLGQIAAIKQVVESDDQEGQKKGRIEAIIANN